MIIKENETMYKLAKIENAEIMNKKTGNYLMVSIEHYENASTGEMMYTGVGTSGKAHWNASNCEVIKLEGYAVDVRIA